MMTKLFSFFLELELDLDDASDDFHDAFKLSQTAKILIWVGCAVAVAAAIAIATIAIIKKTKNKKSKTSGKKNLHETKTGD